MPTIRDLKSEVAKPTSLVAKQPDTKRVTFFGVLPGGGVLHPTMRGLAVYTLEDTHADHLVVIAMREHATRGELVDFLLDAYEQLARKYGTTDEDGVPVRQPA